MNKANYDNPQTRLLDIVCDKTDANNDAHLSRILETHPGVISKIRSMGLVLSAPMILRIHDVTEMSIRDIKRIAGLKSMTSLHQRVDQ